MENNIKIQGLFDEIQKHKEIISAMYDGDTFQSTRWYTILTDTFISQLEKMTFHEKPDFIGEYVIEFFSALIDREEFDI